MSLSYISFFLTCAIVSAVPRWEHTPAERMRLLGPLALADSRINFPCTTLVPSPTVPTSVHALRVADIQHIAAIGDSLTAANGAKAITIIALLVEYRGVSWSMGGDSDLNRVVTLPNIMRKFNSKLNGFSTGSGNQNASNANFNVAKPGAVSADMPGQADLLIARMRNALGSRFDTEWKLVTFFIGGNDLCAFCKDTNRYSATNFQNNIKIALTKLYNGMPRTLVNFVTVLNVAELEDLHEGLVCQNMQVFLCDCAIKKETRELVRVANLAYQKATNALVDDPTFLSDKDDFAIVRQPFMEQMKVPTTANGLADFSYFAPDCFHFSSKGHEAAAVELWNNMMQKVGQKTSVWNLLDTLNCPTSGAGYIYTTKNSK